MIFLHRKWKLLDKMAISLILPFWNVSLSASLIYSPFLLFSVGAVCTLLIANLLTCPLDLCTTSISVSLLAPLQLCRSMAYGHHWSVIVLVKFNNGFHGFKSNGHFQAASYLTSQWHWSLLIISYFPCLAGCNCFFLSSYLCVDVLLSLQAHLSLSWL